MRSFSGFVFVPKVVSFHVAAERVVDGGGDGRDVAQPRRGALSCTLVISRLAPDRGEPSVRVAGEVHDGQGVAVSGMRAAKLGSRPRL